MSIAGVNKLVDSIESVDGILKVLGTINSFLSNNFKRGA